VDAFRGPYLRLVVRKRFSRERNSCYGVGTFVLGGDGISVGRQLETVRCFRKRTELLTDEHGILLDLAERVVFV